MAALSLAQDELRAKSRDLVRRNAWAAAGVEAFVSNAIGTGIKPQSMLADQPLREAIHSLWWDWCEEADAAGLTDFYGLQALACRAMLEGGECLVRLRYRRNKAKGKAKIRHKTCDTRYHTDDKTDFKSNELQLHRIYHTEQHHYQ